MAVESAADRASFVADFGVTVTWTKEDLSTSDVTVIFDADFSVVTGFEREGIDIQESYFAVHAPTTTFPNVYIGEKITKDSVDYIIVAKRADHTGWLTLLLEET